jgi:hypothetical protein
MLGPAQRLKLLSHSADHQSQGRLVSAALQVWAKSRVKVASPPAAAASQALCYSSGSHYASSSSSPLHINSLNVLLLIFPLKSLPSPLINKRILRFFTVMHVRELHAHELFQSWEHYVQSFTKQ